MERLIISNSIVLLQTFHSLFFLTPNCNQLASKTSTLYISISISLPHAQTNKIPEQHITHTNFSFDIASQKESRVICDSDKSEMKLPTYNVGTCVLPERCHQFPHPQSLPKFRDVENERSVYREFAKCLILMKSLVGS